MKVNLYFDNIEKYNSTDTKFQEINSHTDFLYYSIKEHFRLANITFTINQIDSFQESQDLDLFVIELTDYGFDLDDELSIFKKISKKSLNLLKNNKLKLLVFIPYEGHNINKDWFHNIHKSFLKLNLHLTKKFLIINSLDIQVEYHKFQKENLYKIYFDQVFGFPGIVFIYKDFLKFNFPESTDYYCKKEKDFICLNRAVRNSRLLTISELMRRNVIENGFVSFTGTMYSNFSSDVSSAVDEITSYVGNTDKSIIYLKNLSKSMSPIVFDFEKSTEINDLHFINKLYNVTYYSLVTETVTMSNEVITEKTLKPIIKGHPFLHVGSKNVLRWLKSVGFETFPEMFDESYDDEVNHYHRILSVLDQVEVFNNLTIDEKNKKFNSVVEKCKHNRQFYQKKLPNILSANLKNIFREIHDF